MLTKIKTSRIKASMAQEEFIRHCKLKNLRPETIKYYEEDIDFFLESTHILFIDEVNQRLYESFLMERMAITKITSLNSRIRGLRVFFKFCAKNGWMELFDIKLLKEDAEEKEPYTDDELKRLLKQPSSESWVEWRTWAAINFMTATGARMNTVLNIKVKDIDFNKGFIFYSVLKNRKQQYVPLSPSLNSVLQFYLNCWDAKPDDWLFPSNTLNQMDKRSFQSSIMRYNLSRGVNKTSVHLFRHTFAKKFVTNGGELVQLQGWLGHSTLDMSRHYVNLYGQELKSIDIIDNLL